MPLAQVRRRSCSVQCGIFGGSSARSRSMLGEYALAATLPLVVSTNGEPAMRGTHGQRLIGQRHLMCAVVLHPLAGQEPQLELKIELVPAHFANFVAPCACEYQQFYQAANGPPI